MAARTSARRTTSQRSKRTSDQMYVYGNAVPKPSYEPKRHISEPERPKKVSRQVHKNRRQALHMNPSYVMFLAFAAVLALAICIGYVQMQSRITSRSKNIAAMQSQLQDMKEENNTKYNAVMDSTNLDEIRDKAQNELGMIYASPDQIVEYDNPTSDYVTQYEDIPESGILAKSDKSN